MNIPYIDRSSLASLSITECNLIRWDPHQYFAGLHLGPEERNCAIPLMKTLDESALELLAGAEQQQRSEACALPRCPAHVRHWSLHRAPHPDLWVVSAQDLRHIKEKINMTIMK